MINAQKEKIVGVRIKGIFQLVKDLQSGRSPKQLLIYWTRHLFGLKMKDSWIGASKVVLKIRTSHLIHWFRDSERAMQLMAIALARAMATNWRRKIVCREPQKPGRYQIKTKITKTFRNKKAGCFSAFGGNAIPIRSISLMINFICRVMSV